jgi:hypothetical protein
MDEEIKHDNYQCNCKCGTVLSFIPGGNSGHTTIVVSQDPCFDCVKAVWSCSVCKKIIKLPHIKLYINPTFREEVCAECINSSIDEVRSV